MFGSEEEPPGPPSPSSLPAGSAVERPPFPAAEIGTPVGLAVHYGGFWARVLAWLIDLFLVSLLGVVADKTMRLSAGVRLNAGWREISQTAPLFTCMAGIVTAVVFWMYFAGLESSVQQATLGKRALGMRVTDLAGRRISFGRATGRYFGKVLSALIIFIGFLMVAFSQKKQGLHDKIAETLVMRD